MHTIVKKKVGLMILMAVATLYSYSQAVKTITVFNPLAAERKDELVVLTRAFLVKKLGNIPVKKYVQVSANNRPVVVQYDDLNSDGIWDEAVFLYSFQPSERVTFAVAGSDKPATIKAVVRAHVRQRHKLADESFDLAVLQDTMPYNNQPTDFTKQKLPPYLTEGPAWENDKVGFRKYFDVRNANDIWGKVTNRMVLEDVGVDPRNIYHHFDSSWGMDILKVGKSLGAGGLALQIKISGKDSLVRFGTNVAQTTYEQVADGPLRAIFKIKYKGWKIGSLKPIDVTEEISIWGGQYFYENKVTITRAPAETKLVTGLNNFYIKTADTLTSAGIKMLYTYGQQSENGDNLGMAIVVPKASFSSFGQTPDAVSEVLNTYTISEKLTNGQPVTYRYYVGWEKTDSQFAEKKGFESFLKHEGSKASSKLLIR